MQQYGQYLGVRDDDVLFCSVEAPPNKYSFQTKQQVQINDMIYSDSQKLQKLLKHIHRRFNDQGLRYTLIHQLYNVEQSQIQYYVPQLVYIAIKKDCKPMKKLLCDKASNNEKLRRLILWNVKAFTVLMKQKDIIIKNIIEEFEENLVNTVRDRTNFNHSQKAISMLTTASLVLKKMPADKLKSKLQRFIKRFNSEYLDNLKHSIMVPFRVPKTNAQLNSNYLVKIIQDDCSCFPTRKRVPYRVVMETINIEQLHVKKPKNEFFKKQKIDAQAERDLFNEVTEIVNEMYSHKKTKSIIGLSDSPYPYVIDQEQEQKISQLTNYFNKIVKEEKKENQGLLKKKTNKSANIKHNSSSLLPFGGTDDGDHISVDIAKNLKKFQATYIPTLPSKNRRSETHIDICSKGLAERLSLKETSQSAKHNIKIVEEETKWTNFASPEGESIWGCPQELKDKKYRQSSAFSSFSSLMHKSVVVKGGDDLRQEIVIMQIIYKIHQIMQKHDLDIYIKPYEIIVLSENSGILEFVSNSISIDALKKKKSMSIPQFYVEAFESQQKLIAAKENFIRSLVGSSIMTYVLKLKDRHNGNILIDNEGHIIHIDFGFILGMSPGGVNFESSPFKFTQEYLSLIGGKNSPDYKFFEDLFCMGMQALREEVDDLCLLLEIMMEESDLQCFHSFNIQKFKDRFKPHFGKAKYREHCILLIQKSCLNSRTVHYDSFQYYTNGIEP